MISRKKLRKTLMRGNDNLSGWCSEAGILPDDLIWVGTVLAETTYKILEEENSSPEETHQMIVTALANAFSIGFDTHKQHGEK